MPIAIGVVGVLMGGMALFLNFGDSGQMDVTRGAILEAANRVEAVQEDLDAIRDRLDEVTARLDALEGAQSEFVRRTDSIARDTQAAFDRFSAEVQRNRVMIDELRAGGAAARPTSERPVAEGPASSPTPVAEAPAPSPSPEASPEAPEAGPRTHVIESGDNLWNLARRFDISLDELMVANPGINPNRLRPGMEIVIPEP